MKGGLPIEEHIISIRHVPVHHITNFQFQFAGVDILETRVSTYIKMSKYQLVDRFGQLLFFYKAGHCLERIQTKYVSVAIVLFQRTE
jgi:hypothetical protein